MEHDRLLTLLRFALPATIVAVLTFYFKSPYIITVLIILGWSSIGQLVTLDDDLPGGWSNPDGDPAITREAIIWLISTVGAFGGVFWLMRTYPHIQDYRW